MAFSAIGIYSVSNECIRRLSRSAVRRDRILWVKLGFGPAPMLLGFVLGPMLEEHLRRAMLMSAARIRIRDAPDQPRFIIVTGADLAGLSCRHCASAAERSGEF